MSLLGQVGKSNKDQTMDPGFQWGKLPPQDNTGQVTRYMMEMRKPKPYELSEPPPLGNKPRIESPCDEIDVPVCPMMLHSIKLLRYIRKIQKLLQRLSGQDPDEANSIYNRFAVPLLSPPVFESEASEDASSSLRRSRSSSSRADDEPDNATEKIFVAPNVSSEFRCGIRNERYPNMDDETASRLLKKSVGTIAAQMGFEKATSSSLDILTGIAESFIISFTKSLRDTADAEALEGKTPFFDCLDQALHESGCAGFKDIHEYWKTRVAERHKNLQREAKKLSKELKSFQHPAKVEAKKIPKVRSAGFTAAYGKWTPVAGMSSSPASGTDAEPQSSSAWVRKAVRLPVKPEPHDPAQMSNYGFGGAQAEGIRTKAEYSGFEFSNRSPSIELSEQTEDQRTLEDNKGDYRFLKKQRNF